MSCGKALKSQICAILLVVPKGEQNWKEGTKKLFEEIVVVLNLVKTMAHTNQWISADHESKQEQS